MKKFMICTVATGFVLALFFIHQIDKVEPDMTVQPMVYQNNSNPALMMTCTSVGRRFVRCRNDEVICYNELCFNVNIPKGRRR